MNKRELQNFAVWAKDNLENQIKVSLNLMGIHSDKNIKRAFVQGDITVIEGESKTFPKNFKVSRDNIVRIIKDEGYENVVEQFAYTWFNRIVALRFMEVHGYLDHGFKLFPDGGTIEPEILGNLHFIKDDLDLDTDYYIKLKEEDNIEGLYRYILFKQCNALSKILPMLFSDEYEYLEYLLPSVLLTGETIITRIVELEKDNFLSDVEVIGWLYQFYVSHLREGIRKNKQTKQEDIPILSQIFTPDWIVKYMAENSIGRIWLESYPQSIIKNEMKYYVEEAEQTEEVQKELVKIRYKNVKPEDIKIIEPAAGSGHILVYAFDLLLKMYEEHGHSKRDIPTLILKNNLVGLDIDKRATQLGQFALMMKARSIDSRFFNDDRRIVPKVFEIKDSKKLYKLNYKENLKELIDSDWKKSEFNLTNNDLKLIEYVVNTFENAKIIGSLLKIKPSKGYLVVGDKINKLRKTTVGGVFTNEFVLYGMKRLSDLLRLAHFMSLKYDVMITNPPYLSISGFDKEIKEYFGDNYPNSKSDMFAMFMETEFVKDNGFRTLVNPDSWMFLTSYEKLRTKIISFETIISMTHHGMGEFDAVVQTTSFIIRNSITKDYKGKYHRLVDSNDKEIEFLFNRSNHEFILNQSNFKDIPGKIISYWLSNKFIRLFIDNKPLSNRYFPGGRNKTHNNDKFIRFWWEVGHSKIWEPYDKGGEFRRWYGNLYYFVNWSSEAKKEYESHGGLYNQNYLNKTGICWSLITTGENSFRIKSSDEHYDSGSPTIFHKEFIFEPYVLGYLNSKVTSELVKIMNPTLNLGNTYVLNLPDLIPKEEDKKYLNEVVKNNILLVKKDWDSLEISRDYYRHPLVYMGELKKCFSSYEEKRLEEYMLLKHNEEVLNQYFINLANLQQELSYKVDEKYISISLANKEKDIKSLISYLIGVLMGRYSLVEEGLIYAGGDFDNTRYGNYELDDDGIIPIYSKLGMEDGLTEKIIILVKQIYGEDTYKENIDFIAEGLGKKQNETSEETLNRYLNDEFYKDHLKTYQKRPIYWMFSSGKEKGFKVLIYLHRYTEDTLAMINSNYLLPETTRLRNELNDLENAIKTSDDITRRRLEKERDIVNKQYYEAVEYGLVLDHMANRYINLDLDDGVKVNYEKFQNVEIVNERGTKIKKDLLVPIK